MITISQPDAFWLILLVIPTFLYSYLKFRKVNRTIGGFFPKIHSDMNGAYLRLKRAVVLRGILMAFSWIFLSLSLAGISFGTKVVPVLKSGNAVCMVFDISYSMEATDEVNGLSRLDAAKNYAHGLLRKMEGDSVSVVLAKGDGIVAVPLTEDSESIDSILENLSPKMMTSSGSSIGKGVQAAISAFPQNSAQSFCIWLFTDGDETDTELENSLVEAVKYGIPVKIIGFGSEEGQKITAGDGTTQVHTSLKSDMIYQAVENANRQSSTDLISYIKANEKGSANKLLTALHGKSSDATELDYSYEVQPVSRHGIFLFLGVLFFILSVIANEFNLSKLMMVAVCCSFVLTGCTGNIENTSKILKGTWAWHQGDYQNATAQFYQTTLIAQKEDDKTLESYSLFGLGVTYLMEEQYEAALDRFSQISQDSSDELLSACYYNQAIIYGRLGQYDKAVEFYKKAIIKDPQNEDARINLELAAVQTVAADAQGGEAQMSGFQESKENSALEQSVFNIIREEEQKKWRNLPSNSQNDSVIDF